MNYIEEIEVKEIDNTFELYARFENCHKFHKIHILNAPNICGYNFKVCGRYITKENRDDFSTILEKIMNLQVGETLRDRIKKQLIEMGFKVTTPNYNKEVI